MSDPRYTDPRYSDPVRRPSDTGPPRPLDIEARSSTGAMWTGIIVIIIAIVVVVGLAVKYNRTEQASNQPNTPTTTGSAPAQPRPATPSTSGDVSQPPAPAPAQPPASAPTPQAPAPAQPPR